MSAGLVSVTVTPGSTAPVLSTTFPKISPVLTCAAAGIAHMPSASVSKPVRPARRIDRMPPLLSDWYPSLQVTPR